VLASGDVLTPEDFRSASARADAASSDWTDLARREFAQSLDESGDREHGPYWDFVARLERAIIREALGRSRGNQIQAARLLGINRNTLRKKLGELGLGGEAAESDA
jgi:DNA-binding NtrC family response regulator